MHDDCDPHGPLGSTADGCTADTGTDTLTSDTFAIHTWVSVSAVRDAGPRHGAHHPLRGGSLPDTDVLPAEHDGAGVRPVRGRHAAL